MWIARKIYPLLLCNKQFRKREFNFSWSLQMDIVKMSLLNVLLAEKRERRNEEKNADPFTFPRLLTRAQFFSLFFPLILHTWKRREKQKHHYMRASSDDAFLQRLCAPLFFIMYSRVRHYTLFPRIFLFISPT